MLHPDDFNFQLPPELLAQGPVEPRDSSRLMVLDRETGIIEHHRFHELPALLQPGDVLVRNNTKVIPARIFGRKPTGGAVEVLLLRRVSLTAQSETWEAMTKPGLKVDQTLAFANSDMTAHCQEITGYTRLITFDRGKSEFMQELMSIGHTPIPPYLDWHQHDEAKLRQVYQTTFAKITGSAAAPTAGLHFTPELDQRLKQHGVQLEEVTLHVGLGTFLPIDASAMMTKQLHHEWFELTPEVANRINQAKKAGRRVIAVGTTSTRVLETAADPKTFQLVPQSGDTQLFIFPPYQFKVVDALITNFHTPKSSLLMLISALVSSPNTPLPFKGFHKSAVGRAYATAIQEKYRFYSFGDAMLIE